MKILLVVFLLVTSTHLSVLNAQVSNDISRSSYAEKIYVQTDNKLYTNNSTIWFKVTVVNATTLMSNGVSEVLYIDLIGPTDEIVSSKIIKLNLGAGEGYFDLGTNIGSGQYKIRAYTEWNKNFQNDFVFKDFIEIVSNDSEQQLKTEKSNNNSVEINTNTIKDSVVVDFQFFPEGGRLIHGISSKVGFKALNEYGFASRVEGELVNLTTNDTLKFKSNPLGMGHFYFINPNINDDYKARITKLNGKSLNLIVKQPNIEKTGVKLSISEKQNQIEVLINCQKCNQNELFLKVNSRGIKYLDRKVNFNENIVRVNIPKLDLPEGIVVFTLYNQSLKILSERLFFNKNDMSTAQIDLSINKKKLKTKDKLQLSIKIDSKLKFTSTESFNSSILVVNKSRLNTKGLNKSNIYLFLLLESDLRGHIESPTVYLRSDPVYNIDDLMLTQGWRKYKYQDNFDNTFSKIKERGIPIKGIVKSNKPRLKPSTEEFLVMEFGKDPILNTLNIDVPGNFYFELDNLNSNKNIILIEPTKKTSVEKSKIEVVLSKKEELPIVKSIKPAISIDESTTKEFIAKQNEIIEIEKQYFEKLYGVNQLDEVVVYGYTMTPKRKEMAEKYGLPNTVIDGKDIQDKINRSDRLADVLRTFRNKISVDMWGKQTSFNPTYLRIGTAQGGKNHVNMVVVDGIVVNQINHYLVNDIAATEVTSVEVIDDPRRIKQLFAEVHNTAPPPGLLLGSIISIYTRNGIGLFGALKPSKQKNFFEIKGFSASKEFYVPKYDLDEDYVYNKPDFRPTIYWQPNLKSKPNEIINLDFYHSDDEGDFIVIVETISNDGKVAYQQVEYSVLKDDND